MACLLAPTWGKRKENKPLTQNRHRFYAQVASAVRYQIGCGIPQIHFAQRSSRVNTCPSQAVRTASIEIAVGREHNTIMPPCSHRAGNLHLHGGIIQPQGPCWAGRGGRSYRQRGRPPVRTVHYNSGTNGCGIASPCCDLGREMSSTGISICRTQISSQIPIDSREPGDLCPHAHPWRIYSTGPPVLHPPAHTFVSRREQSIGRD